jgi:hypothetical protein
MMALIDSNAARADGTRDLRRSRKTRGIDWINNFWPPDDANAHLAWIRIKPTIAELQAPPVGPAY